MKQHIWRGAQLVTLAGLVLLASVALEAGGTYTFTTVDYPGAAVTQPYGINARGDIVGVYQLTDKKNHGFLLEGGTFASLDFPGSSTSGTIATAIGPAGDIAGYFGVTGGPATNATGFVLDRHGVWTTVDVQVPDEPVQPVMMPSPFRILPNGTLVGCFHWWDAAKGAYARMAAFTLTRAGEFTPFYYPSNATSMVMHYGATPDGKWILGVFMDGAVNRGYLLVKGQAIVFNVPGSISTVPQDISPDGVVVGYYRTPDKAIHGFTLDTHRSEDQTEWEYSLLVDVPGASTTRIRGINAGGDIVGDYIGADKANHGFVATRRDDDEN